MAKELKTIDILGADGKSRGNVEIDISGLEAGKSKKIVSDVLLMYVSNQKKRTANTKSRHEINKTNKKPWKQKGTGRARAGSARSPIWVGGGVAQGPKPRDVYFDIPKTLRHRALKDALMMKIKDGEVSIIDEIKIERPSTKHLLGILKSVNMTEKVLVITDGVDRNFHLSARNLPSVESTSVENLSAWDVVRVKRLLFTKSAFDKVGKKIAA